MKTLIKNALIVNEGKTFKGHIVIDNDRFEAISEMDINGHFDKVIDAQNLLALPGVIDDQVHFREPGLTHKGDLFTESRAAVAGGVTSFMEMPNTNPQTTVIDELNKKFELAAEKSAANYSFYLGATNNNLDEIRKVDPLKVCGIKVFMGASTGNMLVDNMDTLAGIFAEAPCLVATHCEDEETVKGNLRLFQEKYGDDIKPEHHPLIRSEEACYKSSAKAVELAVKYGTKLHILHLSTEKELSLLSAGPLAQKKITGEVCVHHLYFNDTDYKRLGFKIKWNPAVKKASDQTALIEALKNHKLDVVATDHAPHTVDEKLSSYAKSASGGPLVQHSLVAMLELYKKGHFTLEMVVEKMCHAPAKLFQIEKRGFLRAGYFADLVLVNMNQPWQVTPQNILYKCGWSPFEGQTFEASVTHTFVNGQLAYENGTLANGHFGKPLTFNR